jgi:serine phosphatase RsbU (regulator of sigma subunit)
VTRREIDFEAVYRATPCPVLVMTRDLIIVDANEAYLRVVRRSLGDLLGHAVFDVFPDNPTDGEATGVRKLSTSLRRVLATGEPDTIVVMRYDVEVPGRPGSFAERYWNVVNSPVCGPGGEVSLIVNRVEEVTDLVLRGTGRHDETRLQQMEADLYARARELQAVNERLRQAHAQEREVALALQEAMLPPPPQWCELDAAVRYLPATSALNVCGDWYDLVDLPEHRVAVAVGDVVGHGLAAAGVMGQLRSALSAAVRVASGPATALEVLELYAESTAGAECATVVQAVVDRGAHTIAYSSAGHPPPALLHPGGAVEFLDQATDPPLGVWGSYLPRPETVAGFAAGSSLVLYTDGLIERRGSGIGAGLDRLVGSLTRHRELKPSAMADALLADLGVPGEATDDTALVVIGL